MTVPNVTNHAIIEINADALISVSSQIHQANNTFRLAPWEPEVFLCTWDHIV